MTLHNIKSFFQTSKAYNLKALFQKKGTCNTFEGNFAKEKIEEFCKVSVRNFFDDIENTDFDVRTSAEMYTDTNTGEHVMQVNLNITDNLAEKKSTVKYITKTTKIAKENGKYERVTKYLVEKMDVMHDVLVMLSPTETLNVTTEEVGENDPIYNDDPLNILNKKEQVCAHHIYNEMSEAASNGKRVTKLCFEKYVQILLDSIDYCSIDSEQDIIEVLNNLVQEGEKNNTKGLKEKVRLLRKENPMAFHVMLSRNKTAIKILDVHN